MSIYVGRRKHKYRTDSMNSGPPSRQALYSRMSGSSSRSTGPSMRYVPAISVEEDKLAGRTDEDYSVPSKYSTHHLTLPQQVAMIPVVIPTSYR